jgi:hypothetical protein
MPIKERFLSYVELQRGANAAREAFGSDDPRTVDMYQKANEVKREVLSAIEELEHRMNSLEK